MYLHLGASFVRRSCDTILHPIQDSCKEPCVAHVLQHLNFELLPDSGYFRSQMLHFFRRFCNLNFTDRSQWSSDTNTHNLSGRRVPLEHNLKLDATLPLTNYTAHRHTFSSIHARTHGNNPTEEENSLKGTASHN